MEDRAKDPAVPAVGMAFSDARFALVGYASDEAASISRLLASLGSLTHSLVPREQELTARLDYYTAVLLNLAPEIAGTSWASAHKVRDLRTPVLVTGSWADFQRFPAIQINACEAIFRPLWNDELLFRIARAVTRSAASGCPGSPANATARQLRILIADDDPSMASLAAGILRGRGLECHEAHNGRQALELSRAILPDLLILDVHMPLMNGFDVLSSLRDDPSVSAMKVLMFTGDDSRDAVRMGTQLGADGYLCKPFRPYDFIQRVKGLLPALHPATSLLAVRKSDTAAASPAYLPSRS